MNDLEIRIHRLRQEISRLPLDVGVPHHLSEALSAALIALQALPSSTPVGPYSGLTRAELARTGTCETDWY
jgi:hypothetical protein